MYGYNPYHRRREYCRNYYDDYCDYDHHYDFYRRRGRHHGRRYYNDGPYYNNYRPSIYQYQYQSIY